MVYILCKNQAMVILESISQQRLGLKEIDEGFEILSEINDIEIIAISRQIRDIRRLKRSYGEGRWRKLKGRATVRLPDGTVSMAEIHWYEMTSVGRKELKIKRLIK
jgi:hypothetical protein